MLSISGTTKRCRLLVSVKVTAVSLTVILVILSYNIICEDLGRQPIHRNQPHSPPFVKPCLQVLSNCELVQDPHIPAGGTCPPAPPPFTKPCPQVQDPPQHLQGYLPPSHNEAFTGRARSIPRCGFCRQDDHISANCTKNPNHSLLSWFPDPTQWHANTGQLPLWPARTSYHGAAHRDTPAVQRGEVLAPLVQVHTCLPHLRWAPPRPG